MLKYRYKYLIIKYKKVSQQTLTKFYILLIINTLKNKVFFRRIPT